MRSVEAGRQYATVAKGRRSVAVVEAVYRSAREKRVVDLTARTRDLRRHQLSTQVN